MNKKILEVENLNVGYGEMTILENISIHLYANEQIGLFGPNGHGKTTLLRTISGLNNPKKGNILLNGKSIVGLTPWAIVDLGLIHVSQGNILFPRMTIADNLRFGAYRKNSWAKKRERMDRVFDLFPRLAERKNQLCRTLSGGERQMLAIGVGLMADVRVLMLDEPTLGLSPKMKDILNEAILRIEADGIPILLVEQDVEFMLELSDRIYLIEGGRVVLESTPDKVDHEEVLDMYFGR